MSALLKATCALCGESVEISGGMYAAGGGRIGFVSDDAGTKTAWDHQTKHDDEERA